MTFLSRFFAKRFPEFKVSEKVAVVVTNRNGASVTFDADDTDRHDLDAYLRLAVGRVDRALLTAPTEV